MEPRKRLRQQFFKGLIWRSRGREGRGVVLGVGVFSPNEFGWNRVYRVDQHTCSSKSYKQHIQYWACEETCRWFHSLGTLFLSRSTSLFFTGMTSSWLNVWRIYLCLLALPAAFHSCCYFYSSVQLNDEWWISWFLVMRQPLQDRNRKTGTHQSPEKDRWYGWLMMVDSLYWYIDRQIGDWSLQENCIVVAVTYNNS